jgi:hypothetical protein
MGENSILNQGRWPEPQTAAEAERRLAELTAGLLRREVCKNS